MKFLFILIPLVVFSQQKTSLTDYTPKNEFENIHIEKLSSDQNATNFLIYVKTSVKAHQHESHTETLYVLDGEAEMRVGEKVFIVKSGDFIVVPEKTVHAVKVISTVPLKVLSVQAPEFFGKDRIFINDESGF